MHFCSKFYLLACAGVIASETGKMFAIFGEKVIPILNRIRDHDFNQLQNFPW